MGATVLDFSLSICLSFLDESPNNDNGSTKSIVVLGLKLSVETALAAIGSH